MNVLLKAVKHRDDACGTSKASIGVGSPLPTGAMKEFSGKEALLRVCAGKTQQRRGRCLMGRPYRRIISSGVSEPSFEAGFSALIDPMDMPLTPSPSPALGRGEPILTCATELDVVSVRRSNAIPIPHTRTAAVAGRNPLLLLASLLLGVACPLLVWAQSSDRATVSFSDATRPRLVKISLLSGDITVRGYQGKDVVVEVKNKEGKSDDSSDRPKRAQGMKRIKPAGSGLIVEEENNTVTISTGPSEHSVNLTVQVPVDTSLKLNAVDDGDIRVENVTGEIEANNVDGDVKLTQVSGTVIAHTVDGDVTVSLVKVTADKAMSFSSLDGDIDVTFPSDFKASVKVHTNNGEIYSDFDVQSNATGRASAIKDERSKGGKYSVHMDKGTTGTINGGGPEVQFKTFDGDIYIRKAK